MKERNKRGIKRRQSSVAAERCKQSEPVGILKQRKGTHPCCSLWGRSVQAGHDKKEDRRNTNTALFATTAITRISHPEEISLFFASTCLLLYSLYLLSRPYIFLFSSAFYYIKDLPTTSYITKLSTVGCV
jgi:hypothetical protein